MSFYSLHRKFTAIGGDNLLNTKGKKRRFNLILISTKRAVKKTIRHYGQKTIHGK
jgi:hypothetical protein